MSTRPPLQPANEPEPRGPQRHAAQDPIESNSGARSTLTRRYGSDIPRHPRLELTSSSEIDLASATVTVGRVDQSGRVNAMKVCAAAKLVAGALRIELTGVGCYLTQAAAANGATTASESESPTKAYGLGTLDSEGRVRLPKQARDALDLHAGSSIHISALGEGLVFVARTDLVLSSLVLKRIVPDPNRSLDASA